MSIVEDIKNQIKQLEIRLKKIQDECSHPKSCRVLLQEYEIGGVNHDYQEYEASSKQQYWQCTLCDKQWTENVRV